MNEHLVGLKYVIFNICVILMTNLDSVIVMYL
jgi:hypothetical protein